MDDRRIPQMHHHALDAAEKNKRIDFEYLLSKKYKLGILNEKGQTALHVAFYNGAVDIISTIADYVDCMDAGQGPDHADYRDCNGLTHLHVASAYSHYRLVENYLQNNQYVNAQFRDSQRSTQFGFTPLHFAILAHRENYSKKVVEKLIEHGADVNSMDDYNRTPLHLVCLYSNKMLFKKDIINVMEILIDNKCNINAQDMRGNTPLLTIFTTDNDESYANPKKPQCNDALIEEAEQKLTFLLQNNADVTIANEDGFTLLHQVIESLKFLRCAYLEKPDYAFNDTRHVEMIKLILDSKQKIDIEARNDNDETPLQLAVSYLCSDIVELLLEHNANVNNIKLYSDEGHFFKYMNYPLSLKPMKNLLDILDLLYSKGFVMKFEENLTILKFLTHSNGNCFCLDINFFESRFDIFYMMCLNSSEHVDPFLNKFYERLTNNDDPTDRDRSYNSIKNELHNFQKYYFYFIIANIYMNETSKNILKSAFGRYQNNSMSLNPLFDSNVMNEIGHDIASLIFVPLINNKDLRDILRINPDNTIKYFLKSNFNENCLSNLGFGKNFVIAHATKSLMRYYIQKFAYSYVGMLHESNLNDICCLHIVRYLSIKDICNVCTALSI